MTFSSLTQVWANAQVGRVGTVTKTGLPSLSTPGGLLVSMVATAEAAAKQEGAEACRAHCNALRMAVYILLEAVVRCGKWAASLHYMGAREVFHELACNAELPTSFRGAAALVYLQLYVPDHGLVHQVRPPEYQSLNLGPTGALLPSSCVGHEGLKLCKHFSWQ